MIIGITGSLATGKTTAAKYLAAYLRGRLIDADRLAHLALGKNSSAYEAIISAFGKKLLDKKGKIIRSKLADKVFSRKSDLKKLCDIIHPLVIKRIREIIKDKKTTFIIDAPLLIEAGLFKECDYLVVVMASLITQLERSRLYKNLKPEESLSRIKLQTPLYKKAKYADFIIDNNGSLRELKQNCDKLAKKIKNLRKGK